MRTTNWNMTHAQVLTYQSALRRGVLSGQCLTLPGQWIASVEPQTIGCWLWTKRVSGPGYGTFLNRGRRHMAHRAAYELLIGPIPDGLQIDHLCRTPRCVNPTHLEPVTGRVNYLRGVSPMANNARKTHCLRGHPFDARNTWRNPKTGSRQCRRCHADRTARRKAAL